MTETKQTGLLHGVQLWEYATDDDGNWEVVPVPAFTTASRAEATRILTAAIGDHLPGLYYALRRGWCKVHTVTEDCVEDGCWCQHDGRADVGETCGLEWRRATPRRTPDADEVPAWMLTP